MKHELVSALLLVFSMGCAAAPVAASAAGNRTTLCEALGSIEAGERRIVTISGIYVVGAEHQIFYDPNELTCRIDVQPETWIEFARAVTSNELSRLLQRRRDSWESRRAHVTFTGELNGPGLVAPDDLSFPQMAAFANRTRNRRYGHLNAYRTKLVVTEVNDVKSVPESVPWPGGRSTSAVPVVRRAEVPQYPEMAWNVGIAGDVVIDVEVSGGQVSKAEVISGDRMLGGEAVRNVKTWQFATDVSTTFTTTFSFNVETRNTGESTSPRIELDLPRRVRITSARNGW
jgi:TonB family protein